MLSVASGLNLFCEVSYCIDLEAGHHCPLFYTHSTEVPFKYVLIG